MFRSHAPRAVVAALTAVVLIVGLMASTTSAAPKPKPTPTPTPTPSPTPTPTPTPNSDNRIVYFGDAPKSDAGNGVLVPTIVTTGNVYEFTLVAQNDGPNRLTHAQIGLGTAAVAQNGFGDSLPDGATVHSVTLINGEGSCTPVDAGLGALCDLGQFDAGESATVQFIINAPTAAGPATTYASFKVAENVPDQGANRNTFFANAEFFIAQTNSNGNGTYKLAGDAFSLSTGDGSVLKKDSMTTTVSVPGDSGAGAISISETDCDSSCVGQIATVHVREGAKQAPYLRWRLVIIGSISGTIFHELDELDDEGHPIVDEISEQCVDTQTEIDTNCIESNTKSGNASTIIFRTEANGRVKAG